MLTNLIKNVVAYVKKKELIPFDFITDTGRWIQIHCSKKDCKNYGGYWSKSGEVQKNRSYICEEHQ